MSETAPSERRVLVVDDDDSVREVLEHVMKAEGFRVEGAVDGIEAKAKVLSQRPDLIILDLMMPGMSGFEFIRHLQVEGLASIAVVVITGRYTDPSTEQMIRFEPNVVDFLKKPVKYVELALLIHRILKTQRPPGAGPGGPKAPGARPAPDMRGS